MKKLSEKQHKQLDELLESLPKDTSERLAVTHILNHMENCGVLKPGVAERMLNSGDITRHHGKAGVDLSGLQPPSL